jgi:O-antigen/teichoic acid export membrane protein
MSDDEQTLLTEGMFSLVGNITQKALAYAFLFAATSLVAPAQYGIYTWSISIFMLGYSWSNLSIYRSISYFIPQYRANGTQADQATALLKISMLSLLPVSVAAVLIYWQADRTVTLLGRPEATGTILLLLPTFWILLVKDILSELFRGVERVRYTVYIESVCYPLIHLVAFIAFIFVFEPTIALAASFTVGWGITLILAGILFRESNISTRVRRGAGPSFRNITNYSLPLVGGSALGDFMTQMDIILVGSLLGEADPGFFRIAVSVASLSAILPSIFKSISKPLFSKIEAREDKEQLRSLYLTSSRWGVIAAIPVGIYLLAIPTEFVGVLFNDSYAIAATIIPILVISNVFPRLWGNSDGLLRGGGYTKLVFARILLMFSVNLVLDLILIPELGITGAAIGTTAASVVGLLFEIVVVKRLYQVSVTSWTHWAAFMSGAVTFGVLLLLRAYLSPFLAVFGFPIVTVVVYILLLLLSGGLYEEDIRQLEVTAEKIRTKTGLNAVIFVILIDKIRQDPIYNKTR